MTVDLIMAVAMLCTNQYPGYQEACHRRYIRCIKEFSLAAAKKNEKANVANILAICMLEKK